MSDDTRDFPIGLRTGLITSEHRKRMGMAVWEFMWLVDRVTEEYQRSDGEVRGRVLGGAVITADAIATWYEISEDTVRDHLKLLEVAGYITRQRTTNGFRIEVRNSKKWRRQVPDPSPHSDQENGRVGESESWRVGEKPKSPTVPPSDSPVTSIDNAVREDITENIPAVVDERACEGWDGAYDDFCKVINKVRLQVGRQTEFALGQCRLIGVEQQTLIVAHPVDPELYERIQRVRTLLDHAAKHITGQPLRFVKPTDARAGPTQPEPRRPV